MIATNRINTHDILTGDFLDCQAYFFLNSRWDTKTPRWPNIPFFTRLLEDIDKESPKYFTLNNFWCRRYKTNQITAEINYQLIDYLQRSTIYFKEDKTFWWVKENGIQKVNDGRLIINLEIDWIARDWWLLLEKEGLYIFDTRPLTLENIKSEELSDSCFLCPNSRNNDNEGLLIDINKTEKIEGKYTIWALIGGNKGWFRETNYWTRHNVDENGNVFREGKIDKIWTTPHQKVHDWEQYEEKPELKAYILQPQQQGNSPSGGRGVDEVINKRLNLLDEEKDKMLPKHYKKFHCWYKAKVMGEEVAQKLGINDRDEQEERNKDTYSFLVVIGYYNWVIKLVIGSTIYHENFLVFEPREKESKEYFDAICKTILAGVQVGVTVASGGTKIAMAAASVVGAVRSWKEASNTPQSKASVGSINEFKDNKLHEDLLRIMPITYQQFSVDYVKNVNWHIYNDYFPLSNDPTLSLIPNLGTEAKKAYHIFDENWHGWTKLSEKCVIDTEENKVINFLKKNNVFIYSENPPEKEYLPGFPLYSGFLYNPKIGGTAGIGRKPGDPIVNVIRREPTIVWTRACYSGDSGWPPRNSGGIRVSQDNYCAELGKSYYKLHHGNSSDCLEWGRDSQSGTTYLNYPRMNSNETIRLDKTSPEDYFRFSALSGNWAVELVRTKTPMIPINIPPIVPKNPPINHPNPKIIPIDPLKGWPGGKPKPTSPGSGGNPPPPPNLIIPTRAPTQQIPGMGLTKATIKNITQIPQRGSVPNIQTDPLGINNLRQQQQQNRINQQQQQGIRQPGQQQGHTQRVPGVGIRQPGQSIPQQPTKQKTPKRKEPGKKITE
jgi:hypothetical protein